MVCGEEIDINRVEPGLCASSASEEQCIDVVHILDRIHQNGAQDSHAYNPEVYQMNQSAIDSLLSFVFGKLTVNRDKIEMRGLGQEARLEVHDLLPNIYERSENHLD